MTRKGKNAIILVVVLVLIGIGFIVYYSLSNFAWYGKGGVISWASYDDARVIFGDDGLFLSNDFIESNSVVFDGLPGEIEFSGRSKTIHEGKVIGYDRKAVGYHYDMSCNIPVNTTANATKLLIHYYKTGYKPEAIYEKKTFNDFNYGLKFDNSSQLLYVNEGEKYLVVQFRINGEASESELESFCLNNILNNII